MATVLDRVVGRTARAASGSDDGPRPWDSPLLQHMPDVAWAAAADGTFHYLSPKIEDLLGWPADVVRHRGIAFLLRANTDPDARAKAQRAYRDAFDRAETWDVEFPCRRRDGRTAWLRGRATVATAADGEPYALGTFADLTTAKSHELALARAGTDLATLSHEIRTPLTGILGYAELMLDAAEACAPELQRWSRLVHANSQRLLSSLNELLEACRTGTARRDATVAECDAAQVVSDAVSLFRPAAAAKGIELSAAVGPDVPTRVRVDADKLCRLLTNLVSNAVKYTDCGTVTVTARAARVGRRDLLCFDVADTGLGISAADQRLLFEPYRRVGKTASGTVPGTGLGLFIARELATQMGGDLTVTSALGAGSTFTASVRADGGDERPGRREPFRATDARPATSASDHGPEACPN